MGGGWRISLYRQVITLVLVLAAFLCLVRVYRIHYFPPEDSAPPLPFGIERTLDGKDYIITDFPLLLTFCRQVWFREVDRPYSLAGQEQIFHNWFPELRGGLPVAYAPTVLLLVWPLIFIPPLTAYLVMTGINLGVLLALLWGYLFPRVTNLLHLFLIGIALVSLSLLSCLSTAHNPILNWGLIALAWSLLYDWRTETARALSWRSELGLALILFVLSAKPHVAFTLGLIYLAAGKWRPVAAAVAAFIAVGALLAPYFGGWPTVWTDYFSLVTGYHQSGLGGFLRFSPEYSSNFPSFLVQVSSLSSGAATRIDLVIWAAIIVVLLAARAFGKLSLRDFFPLVLTNFFLFSPSLAPSEDWALVLVVAEAPYFRRGKFDGWWVFTALFLFCAVNLRQVPDTFLGAIPAVGMFSGKLLLALTILGGMFWAARRTRLRTA